MDKKEDQSGGLSAVTECSQRDKNQTKSPTDLQNKQVKTQDRT